MDRAAAWIAPGHTDALPLSSDHSPSSIIEAFEEAAKAVTLDAAAITQGQKIVDTIFNRLCRLD